MVSIRRWTACVVAGVSPVRIDLFLRLFSCVRIDVAIRENEIFMNG